MLWSPLVWFRISAAVFFGFGSIVPFIVNEETKKYLDGFYPAGGGELVHVMAITSLSCLCLMFIASMFSVRLIRSDTSKALSESFSRRSHLIMALVFLVLGGVVRYGVYFPQMYGWTEGALPGWVRALAASYAAGIFLLILWNLRNRSGTGPLPILLIAVDLVFGILAFDKSEMAITIIFSYLAVLYNKFNLRLAVFGALSVIGLIYVAQSPVHYGRIAIEKAGVERAGMIDRAQILVSYIKEGDGLSRYGSGELSPLLRLSYLNASSFIIHQYDSGRPGSAHANAFAAFVPGILWPEKPEIGAAGAEAYELIRGHSGASLGVGHFAEAYWSFGWLGIPLIFLPGGLMLSIMSLVSFRFVSEERWLLLPVILYGVLVGYKVTGSWVPDMIGGFVTYITLAAALSVLDSLIFSHPGVKRSAHFKS